MKKTATKYINCELDVQEVKKYLDYLKSAKVPHTVIMSSYTTTIKSELLNLRFMKEEKSLLFFARTKELKKQVSQFLEENELEFIDSPIYYDVANVPDFIFQEIINVDLTSAYLYCLYNNAVIDKTLFDKLAKLPKQDRLAVVGMLASRKQEFTFNSSGEITHHEVIEEKEMRNIFFFCVQTTYFIMQEIKKIVGDDYIFTWVDGIYFKNRKHEPAISRFLQSINYPFKVDVLHNFEFYNNNGIIEIDFLKNNKKKIFNIPLEKNNTFANEIYKYINDKHKK